MNKEYLDLLVDYNRMGKFLGSQTGEAAWENTANRTPEMKFVRDRIIEMEKQLSSKEIIETIRHLYNK